MLGIIFGGTIIIYYIWIDGSFFFVCDFIVVGGSVLWFRVLLFGGWWFLLGIWSVQE